MLITLEELVVTTGLETLPEETVLPEMMTFLLLVTLTKLEGVWLMLLSVLPVKITFWR